MKKTGDLNWRNVEKYSGASNLINAYVIPYNNYISNYIVVLINAKKNSYTAIKLEIFAKYLHATWEGANGPENLFLNIGGTTPPDTAPCNQQGLSWKACVKCAWDDLGSDWLGTLAEISNWQGCFAACCIACAIFPVAPNGTTSRF